MTPRLPSHDCRARVAVYNVGNKKDHLMTRRDIIANAIIRELAPNQKPNLDRSVIIACAVFGNQNVSMAPDLSLWIGKTKYAPRDVPWQMMAICRFADKVLNQ